MPVNPFRYSAPVGGDDLVGREVELEQLLRRSEVGGRQVLEQRGHAPLLELDHDVRRLPGPRVHAAQHDVGALAGQRQLVLDQHLDVVQAGLHQIGGQGVQASLPRPDLGRRGRLLSRTPTSVLRAAGDVAPVELTSPDEARRVPP